MSEKLTSDGLHWSCHASYWLEATCPMISPAFFKIRSSRPFTWRATKCSTSSSVSTLYQTPSFPLSEVMWLIDWESDLETLCLSQSSWWVKPSSLLVATSSTIQHFLLEELSMHWETRISECVRVPSWASGSMVRNWALPWVSTSVSQDWDQWCLAGSFSHSITSMMSFGLLFYFCWEWLPSPLSVLTF